jgi:glutaredoxin
MRILVLMLALTLGAGPAVAGKLYKWTDPDGNVHYTDQPPPADARASERKKFGDTPPDVPLSYALQKAIKNFPVILYSSDCGDACTKASALLQQRGIPFTEKNAREPAAAEELKALTGGALEVPVMKLGSEVIRGYEQGSWTAALDAAGYPSSPSGPPAGAATPKPGPAAPQPRTPNPGTPPAAQPPSPSAQTDNPR